MRDWTGNSRSYASVLGARNFAKEEREKHDFYATDPKSLERFLTALERDDFKLHKEIWECACGQGHLSRVLEHKGYDVLSTDLVDRGYGMPNIDFLNSVDKEYKWKKDILTNPPYKYAKEFVEQALDILDDGYYCVMFLKIQFLEGKARRKLFEKYPPKYVYVFSERQRCAMNGNFDKYNNSGATHGAVAYAWFIWEKGFNNEPTIRWI